ncbi:MAG: DUF1566 domain-containing protein [Woeseiaceae bacterium]
MKNTTSIIIFLGVLIATSPVYAGCNSNITPTKPSSIYTDNGDGTVTDSQTNLMWNKCLLGLSGDTCASGTLENLTWQAALKATNDSSLNGHSDWRLPNKNELISIIEVACTAPAINETSFPGTPTGGGYWASSPSLQQDAYAWYTNGGKVAHDFVKDKNNNQFYVRLVRDHK